jgi:hypothetical protein
MAMAIARVCVASVDGMTCNHCSLEICWDGSLDYLSSYPSYAMDCTNAGSLVAYNFCERPTMPVADPLFALNDPGFVQVLSSNGFATCVHDPMEICNTGKAYNNENEPGSCECTGSNVTATLTCSDPYCPMLCHLDYMVCWNYSLGTIFDANGQQQSLYVDIRAYSLDEMRL